jgi:hypothetical protein
MPRACNLLRRATHYRRECFDAGLRAAGFELYDAVRSPARDDVLVIWNTYGHAGDELRRWKAAGARVLVAENGLLGKTWRGGEWFSLARDEVALSGGIVHYGGSARWDDWQVPLAPWRSGGADTVILAQRGIGSPGVRSPDGWAENVRARIGGRIRQHPGLTPGIPLEQDLQHASAVVTWSSSAAVQALAMGVPVWHEHPQFFGAAAAQPLSHWGRAEPLRSDDCRLEVFRRVAWAMWTLDEIRTGEPIRHALG